MFVRFLIVLLATNYSLPIFAGVVCTTSPELHESCRLRCASLSSWLCLGIGHDPSEKEVLHRIEADAEETELWSVCPDVRIALTYSKIAGQLQEHLGDASMSSSLSKAWLRANGMTHLLLSAVNITSYFSPASATFGPFFHLSRMMVAFHAYRKSVRNMPPLNDDIIPEAGEERAMYDRVLRIKDLLDSDGLSLDIGAPPVAARCSLDYATLLFAAADALRLEAGKEWGSSAGLRLQRLLMTGHACLQHVARRSSYELLSVVAAARSPIFEVLDRLDRRVVMRVRLTPLDMEEQYFWMHVFPTRDIESNYVRAYGDFHCDSAFRRFASARQALAGVSNIVEVGAHLGGCTFYLLTHLGDSVRAVAVEPNQVASAAMRRTATMNGLAERLAIVEDCIAAPERSGVMHPYRQVNSRSKRWPWLHQTDWEMMPEEPALVTAASRQPHDHWDGKHHRRCVALDKTLLPHFTSVDLMRIHVLGRELSVLRSAVPLFLTRSVKAVAVAIFGRDIEYRWRQDALGIARLLLEHGFALSYNKHSGKAAEAAVAAAATSEESEIRGTTTLFAVLA